MADPKSVYTISESKNFIFTAPPKTGNTSIRKVLRPYCDYAKKHPEIKDSLEKSNHATMLELSEHVLGFHDMIRIGSVRNPYDRIVSLYAERHKRYGYNDFKSFVMDMKYTSDYEEFAGTSDVRCQHEWFDDMTFVIRLESINEDWAVVKGMLNIEDNIIHIRRGNRRQDFMSYYDKESRDYVYNRFKEDFEIYGYKR